MDHLLTVLLLLLLLWSSGAQCDTAAQADIVLLVDESDSVSTQNFRYFKQFVANIVRTFDIGPDRVQIGLAQYSHKVNKLWHLNTHQSEDSLLNAVKNMIQRGGGTMTGKALDFIQKMFQPNVGMRLDSEKIVVLITDGKSLDDVLLPSQRLKDVGIEIYAVGIKGASESELRFIASDPKEIHMYQGRTSLFLQDIVNNIIINLWSSVKTSERVRLVGGSSCCAGTLEVRKGEWRPVFGSNWTLTSAAVMCKELDCGSAVSTGLRNESLSEHAWEISPKCVKSGSAPRNCMSSGSSSSIIEITCSGAQCDTAAQADIVLLVDESDSVSTEDFRYFKQFVANIVRTFDIGPDRVQIGLAHYSDVVNTEWHLNTHQSKDSLIEAVGHMRQGLGHRRTGKALDFIQNMFQPNVGMRPDSEKIVVLITDGKSQDDVLVPSQRLKDAGIEIYTVGIKRARQSELRSIASYPKEIHMYQGTTSLFLRDIVNNITINLLNSVKNSERVRLVGGSSRCTGSLEVRKGEWRPVFGSNWTLTSAAVMCKELDCGSAVSTGLTNESLHEHAWEISPKCVKTGSALRNCMSSGSSSSIIEITCSDSVRLVNGTSLCSGRLEMKSNESWSSVCESDFDQQDAEVVCRELGCGAPSVLQGALYGEEEAPMWTKEFQCGGNEPALLDCRRSDSARNTCSPRKAIGLTCSEPVRLVRGSSRCAGTLEVKQGDWRPVYDSYWTLMSAAVMCKELDCGPAVSTGLRNESSNRSVWETSPDCGQSGSALRECAMLIWSSFLLEITCSDPTDFIINVVRLVLLPLVLLVFITVICLTHKATRGQKSDHQDLMELDYHNPGVGRAEGGLTEEEGGKAAD